MPENTEKDQPGVLFGDRPDQVQSHRKDDGKDNETDRHGPAPGRQPDAFTDRLRQVEVLHENAVRDLEKRNDQPAAGGNDHEHDDLV